MNIVLVSQYFWPESFIINDLVKELAEQGHSVCVLTGKPNYPSGVICQGYSQHLCMEEQFIPGVDVFRVPLRPRGTGGARNLFLNYCSFVFNGLKYFPNAIKDQPIDALLVFGLSPITSVIPAIFLKWRTKSHLAVWVQDLWPDSLKATGYIKNPFLLSLVERLVRWIYGCSDTLLVQSKGFIPQVERLADANKIIYYSNSFPNPSTTVSSDSFFSSEFLSILDNHCCFVFAGNLGTAQALDTLLDAAKGLKCLKNLRLILVGSGSRASHIEQRMRNEDLTNVIMAGRYPMEAMPNLFNRAAALIVSLTDEELFSYTIPSKIQAYLAAGRPIIAALNGEGASVIHDAGAGFTCPAEDVSGLMSCMEKIYHLSNEERNVLGQSGRAYFIEHFEMTAQANRLIDILKQRIKPHE